MFMKTKYINENVNIELTTYASTGATKINIVDNIGLPVAIATANTDHPDFLNALNKPNGERLVIIKNYSENEGIEEALIENEVIEENSVGQVQLGFVVCNMYLLTDAYAELLNKNR